MISAYYRLTKPGLVYGNILSVVAGLMLASRGQFKPTVFFAAIVGLCFVMASSCVQNNFLDRRLDVRMERTKTRASASGLISLARGLVFAGVLALIGFLLLYFFTNALTVWIAFAGMFIYVVIYGFAKRRSSFGTVVGSIAGAVPPLVGYCAVSNRLDTGAWILFLILALWQMPHFYAIAIYRRADYQAAGVPVLPLTVGVRAAKIATLSFAAAFVAASLALAYYGYAGVTYAFVMLPLGLWFIGRGIAGFNTDTDTVWGRKMFGYSLVVLVAMSITISLGALLP